MNLKTPRTLIILGRKQQRLCKHLQNRCRAERGGQQGAEHLLETTSRDTLAHRTLRALCAPLPSPACHTREWFFPKSLSSEELTNAILSRPIYSSPDSTLHLSPGWRLIKHPQRDSWNWSLRNKGATLHWTSLEVPRQHQGGQQLHGKQGSSQSQMERPYSPLCFVSLTFKDFSGCLLQARFNHINILNIPMVGEKKTR